MIVRIQYLLIIYVIFTSSAYALIEDASQNGCENNDFENVYFLIDEENFYSATSFYQKISIIDWIAENDFQSLIGETNRTNIYYDFDDLDLLYGEKELLHILDDDLPNYFPDKERIHYLDLHMSPKRAIKFEVKTYNKNISSLDKHPLYGRVKRKERSTLINLLTNISKSPPVSITESLKTKLIDNIHFIVLYGTSYGAITLSRINISNYGVPNTSLLLRIEKFHERQSNLLEHEREYLDAHLCSISEAFQVLHPSINPYSWFGYAELHKIAVANLPSRSFFRKYPEIFSIGQIIILTIIGFLFIYLIKGRYSRSTTVRKIIKNN